MKDEQLYIDGQLVDIGTDTKINLCIKSNLLRDVSKIVSNNTYTIKLPKTARNQRILQHTDLVQSGNNYPYRKHSARYFCNGVELIKNGNVFVLAVSAEAIEVSIVWGLYPAFSELVSKGVTLDSLESEDKILWTGSNQAEEFDAVANKGYFYADVNYLLDEEQTEYWHNNSDLLGIFGNDSASFTTNGTAPRHPVVRVSWLLDLIRSKTGVWFKWEGEAKAYIDTLIIPLLTNKANELTFTETTGISIKPTYNIPDIPDEALISLQATNSNLFSETGESQKLTLTTDATLKIEMSATITYDVSSIMGVDSDTIEFYGSYLSFNVYGKGADENAEPNSRYYCGMPMIPKTVKKSDCVEGKYTETVSAEGCVKFSVGDKVSVSVCKSSPMFGWGDDTSYRIPITFIGGEISVAVVAAGDKVPSGAYFPITYNLPNIKIIDFVKFLACITGTFPLQIADDEAVSFIPVGAVWSNRENAIDWTSKLVAPYAENKPKHLEFKVESYARHNWYKWKEDKTVSGNYDGDLQIKNEVLNLERDVFTFPFAASDGANVPIYKRESNTNSEGKTVVSYKLEKREPRILRLYRTPTGKAGGLFDINMQNIIDTEYADMCRTLQQAKVIKERIKIRDTEIMGIDERVPIYLAQYGRYFAVLNIESENNGVAEVTMMQLVME